MALSIIRRFNENDAARLDASAQRFASRHGLTLDPCDGSPREALGAYLWHSDTGTCPHGDLQRLWQACRCRALGVKPAADIAVSHGHVGHWVG